MFHVFFFYSFKTLSGNLFQVFICRILVLHCSWLMGVEPNGVFCYCIPSNPLGLIALILHTALLPRVWMTE